MDIVVATEIDAPPAAVWDYVRRIERHVEWMHDAVRIDFLGSQREGVGTVFDTLTKVGPLSTTDRMTITEWADHETIGVRHEGAVVGEGRFLIGSLDGDRTSFEWAETLHLPWYFGGRLGEIVARPLLAAIWRRNLRGLRRRLDGIAGPDELGPLLGSGRDTEIWALGSTRVLRRARNGRSLVDEAAVMRHAGAAGYPVPAVHHSDDPAAIVMDRIDGPSMLEDLARRPWRLGRHARTLAELHSRLAEIEAPPGLPAFGSGDRLLHLDLHPGNVILGADGPVVIDWANAARGDPRLDTAVTWVVLQAARPPGNAVVRAAASLLRRGFVRRFEHLAGRPAPDDVRRAAERRLADRNMSDDEKARLRDLAGAAISPDVRPD